MRVFLAIDFPEKIKETLLQKISLFRKSFPDFKWINKSSLHLTIKFIGEVDDSFIPEIHNQLNNAFKNIESFILSTTQLGFFPSAKKARVFFLDLQKSDPLHNCHNIIEQKMNILGIEKDNRHFHPHITLARIKKQSFSKDESDQLLKETIPKLSIKVAEIILMQSELLPSGARYTPVQRFSLRTT